MAPRPRTSACAGATVLSGLRMTERPDPGLRGPAGCSAPLCALSAATLGRGGHGWQCGARRRGGPQPDMDGFLRGLGEGTVPWRSPTPLPLHRAPPPLQQERLRVRLLAEGELVPAHEPGGQQLRPGHRPPEEADTLVHFRHPREGTAEGARALAPRAPSCPPAARSRL